MPPIRHLQEILFPDRGASFVRIIAELSEPETGPAADNLISNEDSYPRVAGELARTTSPCLGADGVVIVRTSTRESQHRAGRLGNGMTNEERDLHEMMRVGVYRRLLN
jgi:hypothetical protein